MSWSPERDMKFGVFKNKGKKLNVVGKRSTHTPSNIRRVISCILNRLEKLTPRKPNFQSKRADSAYPNNANALYETNLAPSVIPKIGELWEGQDEKRTLTKKMTLVSTKIKT